MGKKSTQNGDKSTTENEEKVEQSVEEVSSEVDEASRDDEQDVTVAEEAAADDVPEDKEEATEHEEEETGEEKPETMEELEARLTQELAEKEDRYLRLVAEFENFKKRSAQEMQTRFKFASQPLALNIISGLDNLERALIQAQEEDNEQLKEFVRGMEMVQQQLYDALKQNNVERFDPRGEPFDPNQHEAMGVIETEEVQPDHVAQVFQAGYIMHDRVIRPAMVQVAKKK